MDWRPFSAGSLRSPIKVQDNRYPIALAISYIDNHTAAGCDGRTVNIDIIRSPGADPRPVDAPYDVSARHAACVSSATSCESRRKLRPMDCRGRYISLRIDI